MDQLANDSSIIHMKREFVVGDPSVDTTIRNVNKIEWRLMHDPTGHPAAAEFRETIFDLHERGDIDLYIGGERWANPVRAGNMGNNLTGDMGYTELLLTMVKFFPAGRTSH